MQTMFITDYIKDWTPRLYQRKQMAPTEFELGTLSWLSNGARVIWDIGMGSGKTAQVLKDANPDAHVITFGMCLDDIGDIKNALDWREGDFVLTLDQWTDLARELEKDGIQSVRCDTATVDFSQYPRPDFVFVDAGHTYEAVKGDSRRIWPYLRLGGSMVWHDFDTTPRTMWEGVRIYLRSLPKSAIHFQLTSLVLLKKKLFMRL